MFDAIIVGMGPAGMGASIYAKRSGLNILVLERSKPGGLLNQTSLVDNYLGFSKVSGQDLAVEMFNHINELKIPFKIEEVINIKDYEDYKEVITNKNTYKTKSVIICAGRKPKTVFKDESSLIGKGLSYCAVCDAPLYKGKDVAIIGSGNSAFEEGLYLTNFVNKLYIITRSDHIKADQHLQEEMKKKDNVEILYNKTVKDISLTEDKISSLILEDQEIKVEGIFIYAGYTSSINYVNELNLNMENGYIITDKEGRTNIKGIYAAGDVIKKNLYQIITAVSEGSICGTTAKKELN